MLNVRKLKQDFPQQVLREGQDLFKNNKVFNVKIKSIESNNICIGAKVKGAYQNTYNGEIEIDRAICSAVDSDCDCQQKYDCQHLAAILFYLEEYLEDILVQYFKDHKEDGLSKSIDWYKKGTTDTKHYKKELLQEYIVASKLLSGSAFFLPAISKVEDKAEIAIVFSLPKNKKEKNSVVELQVVLKMPFRSKPLIVPFMKDFLDGIRYKEEIKIGSKKYFFTLHSFDAKFREIVKMLIDHSKVKENALNERDQKSAFMDKALFGTLLASVHLLANSSLKDSKYVSSCFYWNSLDCPIKIAFDLPLFNMVLEYIDPPITKMLIKPTIRVNNQNIGIEEIDFFECVSPGMIYNYVYYRFAQQITRQHLLQIDCINNVTIPKHLFGTFVQHALPEFQKFAEVSNVKHLEQFKIVPVKGLPNGICTLSFLEGELEVYMEFIYNNKVVPSIPELLNSKHLDLFVQNESILSRSLVGEKKILEDLFSSFSFNKENGSFISKSWKKIVKFMTEKIPKYNGIVEFKCPQNLLDRFVYDNSFFEVALSHTDRVDLYSISLVVKGELQGVTIDKLWECIVSKKYFLEFGKHQGEYKVGKILVLNVALIGKIVHFFDEIGIKKLTNHTIQSPIWNVVNVDEKKYIGLPLKITITDKLKEIKCQITGAKNFKCSPIPSEVTALLRPYQKEGVYWLEKMRSMYLNGILADDMGLGKTLQSIASLTQHYKKIKKPSVIICPTSLLYNWKEEIVKFNPKAQVLVIDGTKIQRTKLIGLIPDYAFIVTSYSMLQKDVDSYVDVSFGYVVLDEAQNIKNRVTRNAQSVKKLYSDHKLILSGTPIENSLEELWSLFDFLMPNFLGSYGRFIEKYIRTSGEEKKDNLDYLRNKISPFVLRRMKEDVLDDLPPISEIVYHCQLTHVQRNLYNSYAISARDKLTRLVERDGFEKIQIQILSTLTRLKQICCHPALFDNSSKSAEDSAKYNMLLDLLDTLIKGNHKIVIFSQYTKMLQIMLRDLEKMGIDYSYLDGHVKDRMYVVNEFNQNKNKKVFLVSLKSGGIGLNLVGADTVIHYDMWWNPAVESQATDRVHRIGQKQNVSVYKLVTLNSIEEKIVEIQKKKLKMVKKMVPTDINIMSTFLWEDILDILKV